MRTNINPATRIAQPGQSGHTVWGFETTILTKVGTRYDNAIVDAYHKQRRTEIQIRLARNAVTEVCHTGFSSPREAQPSDESFKPTFAPFGCVIAGRIVHPMSHDWRKIAITLIGPDQPNFSMSVIA